MWKEVLPENCPPTTAQETNAVVFRILREKIPTEEDFKTYAKLYENNPRYKNLCKAYAISFYDTFQNAKKAWSDALERGNNIGNFIGEYEIKDFYGRNEFKSSTGHYSTWFYSEWEIQNFNPSLVIAINEN